MAPKPGNLNPDSKAGNARLGTGRGSNAGRSQPIPKGSMPKPKKFQPPAGSLKASAKPKPKTAKPTLSEVFARQQAKRDASQWNDRFGRISSSEKMAILQKASRGTPAARGGIGGIRAGQRKAE